MTNHHQFLGRQTLGRLSLAAALTLATAGAASAMPLIQAVDNGTDQAQIIEVRGGCGFGEHRGPYGGCRINNGPRGAIRAATSGLPGGCPPGRHRGPYGGCRF